MSFGKRNGALKPEGRAPAKARITSDFTYRVAQRNDRWGICTLEGQFLECDSRAEACDVANAAAELLGVRVEAEPLQQRGAAPCDPVNR
ncbi:hypothetical protein [Rhodoplanes sp. Z2-YC6860]|uniref:hypothetical protein n=1 Tax=Rhodoplanes sp. Z2-YC6860 TaxID=674703 RepID=UPI0008356DF8|nr:hypothetical protein [Rhodoplanes sp. Z2-YC6860]